MRLLILLLIICCGCTPIMAEASTTEPWFGELQKVNNPQAINVTQVELIAFLELDQTDKHEWTRGEYVCTHFATDLHNNAEAYGIRAGIVHTANKAHCFNAFCTTDMGLVFVDNSVHSDVPTKFLRPDPRDFHYYW